MASPRHHLPLVLAALLLGAASPRAAVAAAPITKVVVYSDRALVTRTQQVNCAAGAADFAGLPATLDPKTLAASVVGGGGAEGISIDEEPTAPRGQADVLEKKLRDLDERLAEVRAQVDSGRALEAKLLAYGRHLKEVWGEQAIMAKPPLAAWDAGIDLLHQQALGAAARRRQAEVQQRDLLRQRADVVSDLRRVQEASRRTTIKVSAFLRCHGTRTVNLSYVVPHATWRIAYQTIIEPAKRRATIVARALVQQGTGEDWTNVKVAVSSANLRRDSSPPRIEKLSVRAFKPREVKKILARHFEQRVHLETAPGGATARNLDEGRGPPREQIQLELEALDKATIPADGREVIVNLDRRTVPVEILLEAVPKLFPYVYQRASLQNPFPFAMPPGPMALHHGRAYVGTTRLKQLSPHEPFAVALGVPHDLQADRYVKLERLEKPGVLGSKKKLRHRYEIDLGNWTGSAKRIRVRENIPVTQEAEIEIHLDDDATRPTQWNKDDGILTWDVTVPARSKKKIIVAYTVTLPDAYVVTGY